MHSKYHVFSLVLASAILAGGTVTEAKKWDPSTPYGGCKFSKETLAFQGDVATQTKCLLRKVREQGAGADEQTIPAWLNSHVGKTIDISEQQLNKYLSSNKITPNDVGDGLVKGSAPKVHYFVIHDTSTPEIDEKSGFPANMDKASYGWNDLSATWSKSSLRHKVNAITSRDGQSLIFHIWGEERPMSGIKLELRADKPSETQHIPEARPHFVHVENTQPRLKPKGSWAWKAPTPGLTPAQEKRLALLYITASYQSGKWLIPAYHFNIDQGIDGVHDDPQHMNLTSWVEQVQALEAQITK
uniref:hypothetical protein n=1 Tax=uncultured Rhizobium sp. TaxID=155567 RepID=UPI002632A663|nr:hypothetical protein [uncultured Rhizobium sp.]